MTPRERSFTVDAQGDVVGWSDNPDNSPPVEAGEDVSLGRVLYRLLDEMHEEGVRADPEELRLSVQRTGSGTLTVNEELPGWDDRLATAFQSAAFQQSTAGIELYDAQLTVRRCNRAAAELRGLPASRVISRPVTDLGSRFPVVNLLRRALNGSSPVVHDTVYGHGGDGSQRIYSVTVFKLLEKERTVGVGSVMYDVTESARARGVTRLLAEVEEGIGATLDGMQTARQLAAAAIAEFADAVSVDLIDSTLQGGEAPAPPVGIDVPLRRAAFATTVDLQAVYSVGQTSHFVTPSPYTQALSDLAPRLVDPRNSPSEWLMHDAARAGALKRAGIHCLMIVPLTLQERVLGLVSFYRGPRHPVPFDDADVAVAQQLAALVSVRLEHARCYAREHNAAASLQRSLLPQSFPTLSAVSTAHFYAPGSGQTVWFDVVSLSGARVGLIIGQVPEQGLHASVTMGLLRTALDTLATLDLPPDELLIRLDDATERILRDRGNSSRPSLMQSAEAPRCLYAVYDPVTGEVTCASADWPPPLLTSPDGDVGELEMAVGPPLGHGSSYELSRAEIVPRSLLSFYSPSLLGSGSQWEECKQKLRNAVARAGPAPEAVCDRIVHSLLGQTVTDGSAVLAVQTHRLSDKNVATWTESRDLSAVAACRRRTSRQLEEWDLESHVFTAEIIVSELVTNVIRHTGGTPTVRLIRDEALTIEVADEATTSPHLRHARSQDEDGRGLFIIATLAQRWGTRYTPKGKVVWVEEALEKEV